MEYESDLHNKIMKGDNVCTATSIPKKLDDTKHSLYDGNHMSSVKAQDTETEYTNHHLYHSSSGAKNGHRSSDKGNENVFLIPDTPSPVFAKFASRKQHSISSYSEQEPLQPGHVSIGAKRAINLDPPDRNSDVVQKRLQLISDHSLKSTTSAYKKENVNVFKLKETFERTSQSLSQSHRSNTISSTSNRSHVSPIKAESLSPLSGFVSAKHLLNLSPVSHKADPDFNVEYKKKRKGQKTEVLEMSPKRIKIYPAAEEKKKQFLSVKEPGCSNSMQMRKSVSEYVFSKNGKLKVDCLSDNKKNVTTTLRDSNPLISEDVQAMLNAEEHKTAGNNEAIRISSNSHPLCSGMNPGTSKVQKSSVRWLRWLSDSESCGSDSDQSDDKTLRDILSSASALPQQSEKRDKICNNTALPDHIDNQTLSTSPDSSDNGILNSGLSSMRRSSPILIGHTSATINSSEDKQCSEQKTLPCSPNKCLLSRPLNSCPQKSRSTLSIGFKGQDVYSKYSPDKKEALIKLHMSRLKPGVGRVHASTSEETSSHDQSGKDMKYSDCNQSLSSQFDGEPHECSPNAQNLSSSKCSAPAKPWNSPSPAILSSVFQNATEGVSWNTNSYEENNYQKSSFSQNKTDSVRKAPRNTSSTKLQIKPCLQRSSQSVFKNSVHGIASKSKEKKKNVGQSEILDQLPKRTRMSTVTPRNPIRFTSPGSLGGPNNPIYVDLTPETDFAVRAMTQEDSDANLARRLQEELDHEFAMSLQDQETLPPVEACDFTSAQWSEPPLPSMKPYTMQWQNPSPHRRARQRRASRRVEAAAPRYMMEDIEHQVQHTALQHLVQAMYSRNRYSRGRRRDLMANVLLTTTEDDSNTYEALMELSELIGDVKEKGLTKAESNRLPIKLFKKMESGSCDQSEECLICMCDYEDGDSLKILPCFHQFHAGCIDKWILKNATCPVCRVRLDLR
ncbi:hypothetical protein ACJMK2_019809 [Sinanodonta woodiana]